MLLSTIFISKFVPYFSDLKAMTVPVNKFLKQTSLPLAKVILV